MKLPTLKPSLPGVGGTLSSITSPGSWRADKRSSTQRGYGYKWQQARAGFLAKHPFCVMCLRDAGVQATSVEGIILECTDKCVALPYANVVDHVIPHGGDMKIFWDRKNWQSLCTTHHSGEKQRQEKIRVGGA